VAAVLILAALGAGAWIDHWTPVTTAGIPERLEEQFRPFTATGEIGSTVSGRRYDLVVHGVTGAGQITSTRSSGPPTVTTSGVWVMVDATLTSRDEPVVVSWLVVEDERGRQFTPSGRVDQQILGRLETGVPSRTLFVFEVPLGALTGPLTLRTADGGEHRMDSELAVTLPRTSPATVRAWLTRTAEPRPPKEGA
jgi:hypothetical protein